MDLNDNRYWPFEVLPSDQQTEQHRREIHFLEAAADLGYRPYTFGASNFGATNQERDGILFVRGRRRWEVVLGGGERRMLSAYFDDFAAASEAILLWLRGLDAGVVVAHIQNQVVSVPGCPSGFARYDQDECGQPTE